MLNLDGKCIIKNKLVKNLPIHFVDSMYTRTSAIHTYVRNPQAIIPSCLQYTAVPYFTDERAGWFVGQHVIYFVKLKYNTN